MLRFFHVFVFILMICTGVKGATLYIDNHEGLFESEEGPFSNIRISNLVIDGEFWNYFDRLSSKTNDARCLSFDSCVFSTDETFSFLSGFAIEDLSIINCGLSDADFSNIATSIYADTIVTIDLSNNKLGKDRELFSNSLKKYFGNKIFLDQLILSKNDLCESLVSGFDFSSKIFLF